MKITGIKTPSCGTCKDWMTNNCPYLLRGQEKDDVMYWCYEEVR